jgi:hypothetical protein
MLHVSKRAEQIRRVRQQIERRMCQPHGGFIAVCDALVVLLGPR